MPDEVTKSDNPEQGEQKEFGMLYGRKWRITIYKPAYKENEDGQKERDPENDTEMDVSNLRCIFKYSHINATATSVGTLVVYNMNAATEKSVIEEGFQFSVFAGYEHGQYGEICTCDIVQVIRNRENGVDYRLEMIGLHGALPFDMNFTRASVAAGSKPRDNAKIVCEKADTKVEVGDISENISQQPLPRGKVFFGPPGKYLRDICLANNAFFEQGSNKKMGLYKLTDEIPENHVLKLTPNTGLVGTPKYTDSGIQIKMLLDARVDVNTMIHIDNEIVQKQLISINPQGGASNTKNNKQGGGLIGSTQNQKTVFEEDGEYKVFSVTHSGDTWGDEWFTEVIACSRNGPKGLYTNTTTPDQTQLG